MSITVHHRGRVADFDFAVVGRCTLLVRCDRDRLAPGSFRNLLLRVEQDEARLSSPLAQAAFYLPNLTTFHNPLDIAGAAAAFARRHPKLRAVHVVAPQGGLVGVVIEAAARVLRGLETRFVREPGAVVPLLRLREPDLPTAWHDLPSP